MRENPPLPSGSWNAFAFSLSNTFTWSLALGAPMLLYFKSLGASATVLGIVNALPPLLSILQIPAAHFLERAGYRAFMLRGWTTRTLFVAGMAAVPLLPAAVPRETRMILMLFLLFLFNLSRGIFMCAWLPWLNQWVPDQVRGRFFAREHSLIALALLVTNLTAAWWLGHNAAGGAYAGLFFIAFVGGALGVSFLRRIPDVPVPEESRSRGAPPWFTMLRYRPFLRLVWFNLAVSAVLAGSGVFWIPLLRDQFGASDQYIMSLGAVASLVSAGCLLGLGHVVDRVGSRPLLALSCGSLALHLAAWAAVGAGVLPLHPVVVLGIQASAALGNSMYGLANVRLLMATVPAMGRSHFLALFSAIIAVATGLLPVMWGLLLDGLRHFGAQWGPWIWNNYSVLYGVLVLLALIAQFLRHRLEEPQAMPTEEFFQSLLLRVPARLLSAVLARFRSPW